MGMLGPSNSLTIYFMCGSLSIVIWLLFPLNVSHSWDQSISNYSWSFFDQYPLKIIPRASGMSTTTISIAWTTIAFDDNRMSTSLSSPITCTSVLSSCVILELFFSSVVFILLQIDHGITLVEAPKYTKQLWTLWLNIAKVNRKVKFCDLEWTPILVSLIITLLVYVALVRATDVVLPELANA